MSVELETISEDEVEVTSQEKPAKRKPSDFLIERMAILRHVSAGDIPTIDDLMKHAEKFGTDMVVETAAECGYGLDACVRLMDFCDRQDAIDFKKNHRFGSPKKQKSSEVRCKLLLGIEDEEEEPDEG